MSIEINFLLIAGELVSGNSEVNDLDRTIFEAVHLLS
jgi:hypothetical protein